MDLLKKAQMCLAYGYSLLEHKYWVFRAGYGQVSLWRLIKHDASKFLPAEFFPYANYWQGKNYGFATNKPAFYQACNLHKSRNDHHFEYWQVGEGEHQYISGEFPEECIDEMVADWFGAARAYNGSWPLDTENWEWWQANRAMLCRQMNPYDYARVLHAIEATQERLRRG